MSWCSPVRVSTRLSSGHLRRFRPDHKLAVDFAATAGIGLDHAGVNGKTFPADQPCPHALGYHLFKHATEQSALAKAAVAVLGEGRMIWDRALEPQSAEPPVREIEVRLLAQSPLGPDAVAIADQQHPNHQLRIDRRSPSVAVERSKMAT